MIDFYEFLSRTQAAWLQPPAKILTRLGISPVPSEVQVMRTTKAMKRAAERAPAMAGVQRQIRYGNDLAEVGRSKSSQTSGPHHNPHIPSHSPWATPPLMSFSPKSATASGRQLRCR